MQRKVQVKQSTLSRHRLKNQSFWEARSKCKSIIQKKPHLLLMKWNDFLEQYHFQKQLHTINNSLHFADRVCLKKKKSNLVIQNVPYIESEHISVDQRMQDKNKYESINNTLPEENLSLQTNKLSLKPLSQESKVGSRKDKVEKEKIGKITISLNLGSIQRSGKKDGIISTNKQKQRSEENFTDEQDLFQATEKEHIIQSTNKNSNVTLPMNNQTNNQNSKVTRSYNDSDWSNQQDNQIDDQEQCMFVGDHMRKTACFSYSDLDTEKKAPGIQSLGHSNIEQQNYNHLNMKKHIKSKKVETLLKFEREQQIRRQRAQKIIKEDKQYLKRILSKK